MHLFKALVAVATGTAAINGQQADSDCRGSNNKTIGNGNMSCYSVIDAGIFIAKCTDGDIYKLAWCGDDEKCCQVEDDEQPHCIC